MYRKKKSNPLKHIDFLIIDLLWLSVSFVISFWIRHQSWNVMDYGMYQWYLFAFLGFDIIVVYFNQTYKNVLKRGMYKEFLTLIKHSLILGFCFMAYLFMMKLGIQISRIVVFVTLGIYTLGIYFIRLFWKSLILKRASTSNRIVKDSMLIISDAENVNNVVENLTKYNFNNYFFCGVCVIDKKVEEDEVKGIKIISNLEEVEEFVKNTWVDEVLISTSEDIPAEFFHHLVSMGLTVHMDMDKKFNNLYTKPFVERVGNMTVLTTSIQTVSDASLFMKRSLDVIGGLVGCLITLVLVIVVGPMIYLQSPGPIFYSQPRVGKNGKLFKMYKFRSMVMNADELKSQLMEQNQVKDGMMFKIDHDPRIIGGENGIGNFIRRTSLDEFPQFWNVLKGDMSLVGTRPPTVDEWEKYDFHHHARLAAKPGITGLWQVSGRNRITDFEEIVKLDTEYIRNWDFGLDIKILLKTVLVVLKKDGAM